MLSSYLPKNLYLREHFLFTIWSHDLRISNNDGSSFFLATTIWELRFTWHSLEHVIENVTSPQKLKYKFRYSISMCEVVRNRRHIESKVYCSGSEQKYLQIGTRVATMGSYCLLRFIPLRHSSYWNVPYRCLGNVPILAAWFVFGHCPMWVCVYPVSGAIRFLPIRGQFFSSPCGPLWSTQIDLA